MSPKGESSDLPILIHCGQMRGGLSRSNVLDIMKRCLLILLTALLSAGCTTHPAPTPSVTPTPTPTPEQPQSHTTMPTADTTVLAGHTAAELAVAASRTLYASATTVVLVAENDETDLARAESTAVDLQVPLLLTPANPGTDAQASARLRAELDRLAPGRLAPIGAGATQWLTPPSPAPSSSPTQLDDGGLPPKSAALPRLSDLLVLGLDRPASRAAAATARAAGARVLLTGNPDPRTNDSTIKALASQPVAHIVALGDEFAPADRLRQRIDTAATGVQLPGGGQVVFPARRLVALYGHPGSATLGSLGEQSVAAAVTRAQQVAASYRALVKEPVVPAFEIIATVASSSAGADGNYSNESSVSSLRPWVDAARSAGIYVVLDLQPGRTDFLTQAKLYADLLAQPHVGLALDPEWRLKPDQVHMQQIGSVSAAEVNSTAAWLADFTRQHHLPQKILMVHQFRLDMITDRPTLVTGHDELAEIIHVDGFGTAQQKLATWRTIRASAPANIWWGWKNFYDEDKPTFTPQQTVANSPSPVFVSYQ
jgi:hypothetical protein